MATTLTLHDGNLYLHMVYVAHILNMSSPFLLQERRFVVLWLPLLLGAGLVW